MGDKLKKECQSYRDKLVAWRRYFHQYPELSFFERKTTKKIEAILKEIGLDVYLVRGGVGVVADLKGVAPGPTIALRADIDALPIEEETGKEYTSKYSGVMHACGHDGHMAIVLGAAHLLSKYKNSLKGTVRFIFQPAEEKAPGGARIIIDEGFLDGVDYIYGLHLWSGVPVGKFQTVSGPMMASSDKFSVKIFGKGGHAAIPQDSLDAVLIASNLVINAQHIISRKLDPLQSGVVTFGKIQAGSNFNIIADKAELEGTVRALNENDRNLIKNWLEQTIEYTCRMHGVTYQFNYEDGYPAVINHEMEASRLMKTAEKVFGENNVVTMQPIMAGEDFSYYLQKVPGSFCFVGAGNKEKGMNYPHHHPKFDIDEEALSLGLELLSRVTLEHPGDM